jgi:MFS family permease
VTFNVANCFYAQLIRELGITGGDDAAVGYYAGIIVGRFSDLREIFPLNDLQESLFFVAQALTVLRWSRLSDRIGRKPVLLAGLSGTCISMLCFGLSTNFWSLVVRYFFSEEDKCIVDVDSLAPSCVVY